MNRLCRKDVFRNKIFLCTLTVQNVIYFIFYFLSAEAFEEGVWRLESFYVLALGISMPFVLYGRYGDKNQSVISNSVCIRLKKEGVARYYLFYFLWILADIFIPAAVVQILLAMFSQNYHAGRELLFLGHILLVCVIFLLLFFFLIHLIQEYLWAAVLYFLGLFGLILFQAPASLLWYRYEKGIILVRDWCEKGILAVLLTVLCIFSYKVQIQKRRKK